MRERVAHVLLAGLLGAGGLACRGDQGNPPGHPRSDVAPPSLVAAPDQDPRSARPSDDSELPQVSAQEESLLAKIEALAAEKSQCEGALRAAREQCDTRAMEENLKEANRRVAALHLDQLSEQQEVKRRFNEEERAQRIQAAEAQQQLEEQAEQEAQCRSVLSTTQERAAECQDALATTERTLESERSLCSANLFQERRENGQLREDLRIEKLGQLQLNQHILQLQQLLAARGAR